MSDHVQELIERGLRARREHRPEDARRNFAQAVANARRDGLSRELVPALKGLAQIARDEGHDDDAVPLYEEAVAICRALDHPLLLAHTIRHLGDVHLDAGRLVAATPCYEEALDLYRGHDQTLPLDLANAIRGLAILREIQWDPDEAKRLWREALYLYSSLGIEQAVAECSARLARLRR
jgi:tetratricopeptide (TPR) repeat protein